MNETPAPEHAWLQQLVGQWTAEMESMMGPDQPKQKTTATETVRSLDGLWTLGEGTLGEATGETPGGITTSVMTLGYSPAKKKFVGTFVASCMTHLWIYEGELDAAGKVLTLNAEGPSFTDPGKNVWYRDVIEFITSDHRTLRSFAPAPDGNYVEFMTAHYRRLK